MIIERILDILQAHAEASVELFDITFSSYPTALRKARRSLRYGPEQFKTRWSEQYRARQQFYSLLNYLKREGFIEKKKKYHAVFWKITKTGVRKLRKLKEAKTRESLSLRTAHYPSKTDTRIHVVTYDVPEKEKMKRVWLRAALMSLGFSYVQKSVWMGKKKIPERFVHDLRERSMLEYVHIFAISKEGTIKEIAAK